MFAGLLSLAGSISSSGRRLPHDDNYHHHRKTAATRVCDEVIGISQTNEIADLATYFINEVLSQSNLTNSLQPALRVLLNAVQYNVKAIKICGTCTAINDVMDTSNEYGSFNSYCGNDIYGYNAQHSALLFIPVVNGTEDTISIGEYKGFVSMHTLELDATKSPSETWPTNLNETLDNLSNDQEQLFNLFSPFLDAIMAAATGAIAIIPDYIGYGETQTSYNRTAFYEPSYMQAAIVSYYAAQQYVRTITESCSILGNELAISGASEGSFGAVSATIAFQRMGKTISDVFLGVPILNLEANLMFIIGTCLFIFNFIFISPITLAHHVYLYPHFADSYLQNQVSDDMDNAIFQIMVPFVAFAASIETPGYANTGSGQTLLSDVWINVNDIDSNAISWFANPNPLTESELFGPPPKGPVLAYEILNEDLVQLLIDGISNDVASPCSSATVSAEIDKLCEFLIQANVISTLASTNVATSVCYSPEDTVIAPTNFPTSLFDNDLIQETTQLISGLLPVRGDHAAASLICKIDPVLYYVSFLRTLYDLFELKA